MYIASERCGEENIILPVVGVEPQFLGRLALRVESNIKVYYKQEVLGKID
jgi:hypothetical protein